MLQTIGQVFVASLVPALILASEQTLDPLAHELALICLGSIVIFHNGAALTPQLLRSATARFLEAVVAGIGDVELCLKVCTVIADRHRQLLHGLIDQPFLQVSLQRPKVALNSASKCMWKLASMCPSS